LETLGSLDRDLLYIFVAGPGQGEGIAVALPGGGWLLVDGCTTGIYGEGLPLQTIVTRWRRDAGEPVVAMVLTHPHQDHVGGFAELVNAFNPTSIALVGDATAGVDLLSHAWRALVGARATADKVRSGSVKAAMIAIARWSEEHPHKLVPLHQGMTLPVGPTPATIVARSPELTYLGQLLSAPDVEKKLRRAENHLSVVLEIEYGEARVVLSSDLPRYLTGTTTPIRSGWDQVLSKRPQLGSHAGLKIPHHGSAEATHPDLMSASSGAERAWIVTPYNSSKLPRVADLDGLPRLLEQQAPVLLTGVPTSKKVQAAEPHPGAVFLSQLASRIELQRLGEPFLDIGGVDVTPGDAGEPLDPVWCVAFDRTGQVVGRWRGRSALEVFPDT
jgi:hypothetical protein